MAGTPVVREGSPVGEGAGVRMQAVRLRGGSGADVGWSTCVGQLGSVVWFSERGYVVAWLYVEREGSGVHPVRWTTYIFNLGGMWEDYGYLHGIVSAYSPHATSSVLRIYVTNLGYGLFQVACGKPRRGRPPWRCCFDTGILLGPSHPSMSGKGQRPLG